MESYWEGEREKSRESKGQTHWERPALFPNANSDQREAACPNIPWRASLEILLERHDKHAQTTESMSL